MSQQPKAFATPFGTIKLSETENKLLKGTVYNTVAILLLALIAASAVSVYYLFYIFLTPLMWAFLIGTCIFPFKRTLTHVIQRWSNELDNKNRTLVLGIAVLPFNSFIVFGEWLTQVIIKRYKLFLLYIIGFPTLYFVYNLGIFSYAFSTTSTIYNYASTILLMFGTKFTLIAILTLLVLFLSLLFLTDKFLNLQFLKLFSSGIWILTIVYLSSFLGSFGLILFTALMFLFVLAALTESMDIDFNNFSLSDLAKIWEFIIGPPRTNANKSSEDPLISSEVDAESTSELDEAADSSLRESPLNLASVNNAWQDRQDLPQEDNSNVEDVTHPPAVSRMKSTMDWCYSLFNSPRNIEVNKPIRLSMRLSQISRISQRANGSEKLVNKIFVFLMWSHIIVYSWNNMWLILIMFIAMLLVAIKKLLTKFEITDGIIWLGRMIRMKLTDLIGKRTDVLFPVFIRGFVKLFFQFDERMRTIFRSSIDSLVSVFLIFMLLLVTCFLAVFLAFQVHNESLHLVALARNVVNSTLSSDLYSWLPARQDIEPLIDSLTKNGYIYGRQWISNKVDQMFDTDKSNKARIEESMLELWEKLYERVILKNGTETTIYASQLSQKVGPRHYSLASIQKSITNMWDVLTTIDVLDLNKISGFVRENLGLLSTVLESIWTLLRSNINLALSIVTGVISVIFGGGTVVLNFIVSFVIFLSALFFLLSTSTEMYLPMELLSNILSSKQHKENRVLTSVYESVQNGISSVFAVTLKMACFYGFYTSLTHTLAGVNFVVIPSITAAVFAVVPIFGTYWAAVPAITELIVINQDYFSAGILFAAHLLPLYAVDTAIYSEIQETGHPYLTGLAIAGGIYWFGLEGAVFGPLLLCSLVIVLNLIKLLMYQDTSSNSHSFTVENRHSSSRPASTDVIGPTNQNNSPNTNYTNKQRESIIKKSKSCDKSQLI